MAKYYVSLLGAFLRWEQYKSIEHLLCSRTVSGCGCDGALSYMALDTIRALYAMSTLWLIRHMVVNFMAFVAAGRLKKVNWGALEDQKWFLCNYAEGKVLVLAAKCLLIFRSAGAVEAWEVVWSENRPKSCKEFVSRGMSMYYARLGRGHYLADRTVPTNIPIFKEQGALAMSASLNVNVAVAHIVMPEECSPSTLVTLSDEEDWTVGALVKFSEWE